MCETHQLNADSDRLDCLADASLTLQQQLRTKYIAPEVAMASCRMAIHYQHVIYAHAKVGQHSAPRSAAKHPLPPTPHHSHVAQPSTTRRHPQALQL